MQPENILPPGFPTKWADITFGQFVELDKFGLGNHYDFATMLAILYASPAIDPDGICRLDIGTSDDKTSVLGMFTELLSPSRREDGTEEAFATALRFLRTEHGYGTAPVLTIIELNKTFFSIPHTVLFLSDEFRNDICLNFSHTSQASQMLEVLALGIYDYNSPALSSISQMQLQDIRAAIMNLPLYYVYSTALHLFTSVLKTK